MDIGLKIALAAFAVYALVVLAASHGFWSWVGNLVLGAVFGAIMHFIVAAWVFAAPVMLYLGLSRQGYKYEIAIIVQGTVTAVSLLVMAWWRLKDAAKSVKGRPNDTPSNNRSSYLRDTCAHDWLTTYVESNGNTVRRCTRCPATEKLIGGNWIRT